jgi:hypothetical protein
LIDWLSGTRSPEPAREPGDCAPCRPEIRYGVRRSFHTGWAVLEDVSADGASPLLGHDPGRAAVRLLLPGRRAGQTHTRVARAVEAEPGAARGRRAREGAAAPTPLT